MSTQNDALGVLKELVDAVNQTGGLVVDDSGDMGPVADPSWYDLGTVVQAAEQVLKANGVDVVLTIEAVSSVAELSDEPTI